ncbi:MAG: CDP-alcohol phosphatidyltransferase family protein [Candidatus Helarchaeales archaeon]
MKILKMLLLKDYVTLGNCVCGALSICMTILGLFTPRELPWGFWLSSVFIFFGMTFDLADGWVARKLNQANEIGVQIDSLSDVITFVVAPAILIFAYFGIYWNEPGPFFIINMFIIMIGVCFFVACGTTRLAWFNVEETIGYRGLPTPITALMLVSLYWNDLYSRYNGLPGSDITFLYGYLNQFFMLFSLPGVLLFFMILFGFCNISDHLRFSDKIRKKSGFIIPLVIIASAFGAIIGLINYFLSIANVIFSTTSPAILEIKFFSMVVHLLILMFFSACLAFIGLGFKNYLRIRNNDKEKLKTSQ